MTRRPRLDIDRRETALIRHVARLAPWLAPLPAAYFIGRASFLHLFAYEPWQLGIAVSLVIGLVVELVSLAAFHTWLDLGRWNRRAKKQDWEQAPTRVIEAAIGAYLVSVVVLLVVLEAVPAAARWAPVLFPFLGVAGVLVLGTIGQHGDRKARYGVDDSLKATKEKRGTTAQPTPKPLPFRYVCVDCNEGFNDQHEYAGHRSVHKRRRQG